MSALLNTARKRWLALIIAFGVTLGLSIPISQATGPIFPVASADAAAGYPTLRGTTSIQTPPVVQVASGNYYTVYWSTTVYQVKRVLIPANNCLRFWNGSASIVRCAGSTSVWHNFSYLRVAPYYYVGNVY